ncbi:MAG: acyl-CoA dehydrogenase family protein [Chloroflexota bacterium]|nr:acyl-CoA dehydrogenase family protein [Chloroflexota bacterium]
MDFQFTDEQERLRKEVDDFLEEEISQGTFQIVSDAWLTQRSKEFTCKVGQRGWIGMTWPKEYGGQGRSYLDRLIVTEEMMRYGAPTGYYWGGDRQIGPAIIANGTEEQRKEFLPKIITGEVSFAIGMSEPEAGSDLAALNTRAVAEGDEYVLNGQKVWTSGASYADYLYLVVRTNPNVPKHKGISEFIVDLKVPGIQINTLESMTGVREWTEVFFNDVRVSKTCLVGKVDQGWYQIASQLDYERAGIERLMSNYPLFKAILKYATETKLDGKCLIKEPSVRYKLSDLIIKFEVGRLLIYRVAWSLTQGEIPNVEAAMAKAFGTKFEQELADVATLICGPYGQLMHGSKWVPLDGWVSSSYLCAPAYSVQGGTTEILKTVLAQRGLGLPRG